MRFSFSVITGLLSLMLAQAVQAETNLLTSPRGGEASPPVPR